MDRARGTASRARCRDDITDRSDYEIWLIERNVMAAALAMMCRHSAADLRAWYRTIQDRLTAALRRCAWSTPFARRSPRQNRTLVGAVTMLMVMAAVAAYLPARRASRIDPMRVLRAE